MTSSIRIGYLIFGLFFLILPAYRLLRTSTNRLEQMGAGLMLLGGTTFMSLGCLEFSDTFGPKLGMVGTVLASAGALVSVMGIRQKYSVKQL